jgi:hypothetical protein
MGKDFRKVILKPREFRRRLKDELLQAFEQARHLADEYEWSFNAAHAPTVGDEAKVRSHASDPTGSVALNGYVESSERDRELKGKAALRRQMEKSQRHVLQEIIKLANTLDGESRKLERAMSHLKPGPSMRNPRFEQVIRGDTTLGKVEMMATLEARDRRAQRGEAYGG